jgi:hypothetical protein
LESRAVCEQINKQTANETIMVVEQTTGWYVAALPCLGLFIYFEILHFLLLLFLTLFSTAHQKAEERKKKKLWSEVKGSGMGGCATLEGCGNVVVVSTNFKKIF